MDETVKFTLSILPSNCIYASMFISACIVSMATGSAFGSVATLGPICAGMISMAHLDPAFTIAIVVGGVFFGDNLSFISDTTIVVTSTQGCNMKDKFKVNLWIVMPFAILLLLFYFYMGKDIELTDQHYEIDYIKVIPYAAIIILAICGIDVFVVLVIGILLNAVIGMTCGDTDVYGFFASIGNGLNGVMEVSCIVLLSTGLLATISDNGGLDYLMQVATKSVRGRKGAQAIIALLTVFLCICTAFNTVALITISPIASRISQKYGLDGRKVASLMDTSACTAQGLLPYGAHLLLGAQLVGISSFDMLPYLYYPMLIGLAVILSIVFDYPKKFNANKATT